MAKQKQPTVENPGQINGPLANTRKKRERPFVIERQKTALAAGGAPESRWAPVEPQPVNIHSAADARAYLQQVKAAAGNYRVIRVHDEFEIEAQPVTKLVFK